MSTGCVKVVRMPTETVKRHERLLLEVEGLNIAVEGYKAADVDLPDEVKYRADLIARHAQMVAKAAYAVKDGTW